MTLVCSIQRIDIVCCSPTLYAMICNWSGCSLMTHQPPVEDFVTPRGAAADRHAIFLQRQFMARRFEKSAFTRGMLPASGPSHATAAEQHFAEDIVATVRSTLEELLDDDDIAALIARKVQPHLAAVSEKRQRGRPSILARDMSGDLGPVLAAAKLQTTDFMEKRTVRRSACLISLLLVSSHSACSGTRWILT